MKGQRAAQLLEGLLATPLALQEGDAPNATADWSGEVASAYMRLRGGARAEWPTENSSRRGAVRTRSWSDPLLSVEAVRLQCATCGISDSRSRAVRSTN